MSEEITAGLAKAAEADAAYQEKLDKYEKTRLHVLVSVQIVPPNRPYLMVDQAQAFATMVPLDNPLDLEASPAITVLLDHIAAIGTPDQVAHLVKDALMQTMFNSSPPEEELEAFEKVASYISAASGNPPGPLLVPMLPDVIFEKRQQARPDAPFMSQDPRLRMLLVLQTWQYIKYCRENGIPIPDKEDLVETGMSAYIEALSQYRQDAEKAKAAVLEESERQKQCAAQLQLASTTTGRTTPCEDARMIHATGKNSSLITSSP